MQAPGLDERIKTWQRFCKTINWQTLVKGFAPRQSGCGVLYEVPTPLGRDDESLAIADMRQLIIAEPHYHPTDNWEVYIMLQGAATIYVGDHTKVLKPGGHIIIPPNHAHFTVPQDRNVVLAAFNLPPFKPENYIVLRHSDRHVMFDQAQYEQLAQQAGGMRYNMQ